jgi:lambda family phage tail tape measure protein
MAAKMISDLVMLSLYNNIIGPLFGNSMGNSLFAPGPSGYTFPSLFGAADGAAFSNSIKPFAMGGIVSSPTLFKFADGGAMNTGVMGEAGPEAILPLSRGSDGKLGVSANGSSGNTNVTVNVDASGSKVQGDNTGANQLGRAVAAAVQDELLRQKRPGGLLS